MEEPKKKKKTAKRKVMNEDTYAKFKNKAIQESRDELMELIAAASANPYDNKIGSVPYGLPTLALTRRNLEVQLMAKQIEMMN